jgi:protein ImuB
MFAVVQVPGFSLQALLRAEPALHLQPVAILDAGPQLVAHGTAAALASGVAAGQTVPLAVARCAKLLVRSPRPDLERDAEAALLAAAFSVSSQVELTAPGVCTLELTGLAEAKRAPALRRALAGLAASGLEATAGFAPTPLLAFYAARQAGPGELLGGTPALLAPLPLAAADPSPELAEILRTWGIQTLGQLTALTKADVTHRLGRAGLELWERASGGSPRPLRVVVPARTFSAALDCEHELETLESLLFIFRRFVDRLALELRNARVAALALELTLDLTDETSHTHAIRLPEPVTDANLLFRALHTYLETLRTAAAIKGVRLRVVPGRSAVRQQELFDGGLRDPHGFADTLARVMALVGSDRVGTPVPENTHRPDAFKLISPPPTLAPLPDDFAHPPRGLALRRHRPPMPAKVELAGRTPAYVWTATVQDAVSATAGPWHSSGDWWEANRHWQHEEWDVELAAGGIYRLRRTPAGWFLEGEYD